MKTTFLRAHAGLATAALFALMQAGLAQAADRSGKEVVDTVCAGCHATGANGAPKIGDRKAWSQRVAQGLTTLTQSALNGVRAMPSHGGKLDLSDLEIGRAVTYMVNKSGGHWKEPASAKDIAAERSGKQIVDAQCSKCHAKGVGGAPKIGDRKAWTPRLTQGMDALVRSAIHGHGGMPPRGNQADLTDSELKAAITYMFNPVAATKEQKPASPHAAAKDDSHKTIEGTDIFLGVLTADSIRAGHAGADADRKLYGGVPSGSGYFLVNVTLRDSKTRTPITDAEIEARVANALNGETRKMEVATLNGSVSYGNYFKMPGREPYTVTLQIKRPGAGRAIEAKFDLKR